MKHFLRMLVAVVCCALLGACDLDAPKLASASVSIHQAGQSLRSWQLSRAQVASLERWLEEHRTGWNPDMAKYVRVGREVRRDGCKTVTVRETRPDGSVVTRTRSRC